MKILTILSFCFIAITGQAQIWDCNCDESAWDSEGLCIEVAISDSVFTDSGELVFEEIDFQTWVPSACYAECWGFSDYTLIDCDSLDLIWLDCDSIWNDDWDDGDWGDPFDCDCDEDAWESDGICIEISGFDSLLTGSGTIVMDSFEYVTWVPSECYADCWGYTDYKIVDCDDGDWGDPFDCDCDEGAWESDGICIEISGIDSILTGSGTIVMDSFEYVTWVPSECHADCWGYTDYEIVDCDDGDWGDPFDCDCDEDAWDGEGICIEVMGLDSFITASGEIISDSASFVTWVPSECYADCWGYTDYEIVECDDGDWGDPFDCDCDEDAWDGEGICIEVMGLDSFITASGEIISDSASFVTWVPSECYADCWGYTDYEIVDCDSLIFEDDWDDCDCEFNFDDEPVCVLTDALTGEICPFPNMCFAECAGYDSSDVVDCDEFIDIECFECFDEPIDPVCVADETGFVFPVPNMCFAECLGFDVVDESECGGFIEGTEEDNDLSLVSPINHSLKEVDNTDISSILSFPNPATDVVNLSLIVKEQQSFVIAVSDLNGKLISSKNYDLLKGMNSLSIDVSMLIEGMYLIQVKGNQSIHTESFIKQ